MLILVEFEVFTKLVHFSVNILRSQKLKPKSSHFDVRDNRRWTFSLEEELLWIIDSDFS